MLFWALLIPTLLHFPLILPHVCLSLETNLTLFRAEDGGSFIRTCKFLNILGGLISCQHFLTRRVKLYVHVRGYCTRAAHLPIHHQVLFSPFVFSSSFLYLIQKAHSLPRFGSPGFMRYRELLL